MSDITIDLAKFDFDNDGKITTSDPDMVNILRSAFDTQDVGDPGDIFGHTVNECTVNNGCGNNVCSEAFMGSEDVIFELNDFASRNGDFNRMVLEGKLKGVSSLTLGVKRFKVFD